MVLSFILIQNRQYVLLNPSDTAIACLAQWADNIRLVEGRRGWQSGMRRTA
jgi:hypothetical protein